MRLQRLADGLAMIVPQKRTFRRLSNIPEEESMNTIIYIVGLVVIIGVILSYFGFR
jgi:hypothetical protein